MLWRMAVEYMVTCDEIGLQTAREVLLHVPLRILEPHQKLTTGATGASPRSHLEDLLEFAMSMVSRIPKPIFAG
jgi:hypothetical protein